MTNTINYYENNANFLINRFESAEVKDIQQLLIKTFKKDGNILGIGCDYGRDASFITKNNTK